MDWQHYGIPEQIKSFTQLPLFHVVLFVPCCPFARSGVFHTVPLHISGLFHIAPISLIYVIGVERVHLIVVNIHVPYLAWIIRISDWNITSCYVTHIFVSKPRQQPYFFTWLEFNNLKIFLSGFHGLCWSRAVCRENSYQALLVYFKFVVKDGLILDTCI